MPHPPRRTRALRLLRRLLPGALLCVAVACRGNVASPPSSAAGTHGSGPAGAAPVSSSVADAAVSGDRRTCSVLASRLLREDASATLTAFVVLDPASPTDYQGRRDTYRACAEPKLQALHSRSRAMRLQQGLSTARELGLTPMIVTNYMAAFHALKAEDVERLKRWARAERDADARTLARTAAEIRQACGEDPASLLRRVTRRGEQVVDGPLADARSIVIDPPTWQVGSDPGFSDILDAVSFSAPRRVDYPLPVLDPASTADRLSCRLTFETATGQTATGLGVWRRDGDRASFTPANP